MKPLSITLVISIVLIFASCHSHKEIVAAKPVNPHCRCAVEKAYVEKAYFENPIQPAPGGKMPALYGAPGNAICPCGIDDSDQGQARAGYGTPRRRLSSRGRRPASLKQKAIDYEMPPTPLKSIF